MEKGLGLPEPVISIIIPTHNYGHMIEDAFKSVIGQERNDVEIVVVDDASTDNTREVASRYSRHLTYFRLEENAGPASAWQYGLEQASGEFVCKLDADDWQLPGYLDTVEAAFRADSHIGMVVGSVLIAREGQKVAYPKHIPAPAGLLTADDFRRRLLDRFFFYMPAVAARRSALVDHLPIRADLRVGHDWEFFLRAMRGWSCWILDQPLAVYRVHRQSLTRTGRSHSRLRQDMERLLASTRDPQDPAYLASGERRRLAQAVAATYLLIAGQTLTPWEVKTGLSELRFAMALAGRESYSTAVLAAAKTARLAVARGIQALVDSRRDQGIPLASVLPGGSAWRNGHHARPS